MNFSSRVRLYSRPECHLCEDAKTILNRLQPEFGFSIEEIDISRDAALMDRYGEKIPVIVFENGREVVAPVSEYRVRKVLELG
ncbi:MAG: hypothetical protein A2Z04_05215 [Chloroflexi bacterium RBG_16_57_9]|nr:MAG: hypothetical protein A2Z04_05215 [Chloroflexi bacterium RBG_16_57_9]